MLAEILKHTGVDKDVCASLLGIDRESFSQWVACQRPIPESVRVMLATVLGVPSERFADCAERISAGDSEDLVPAIWYKLRETTQMSDVDKEYALLARHLAFNVGEFEEAVGCPPLTWRTLFKAVFENTDFKASPKEQGRTAAQVFRNETGLAHGANGIGEVLRGHLKSKGILVIESPIQGSKVEGFSFFVGERKGERLCVFANNYSSTWFRRNFVILHEVCHGIFDVATQGASVDFSSEDVKDLAEVRAQAFAQEVLVPKKTLKHVATSLGIRWEVLTSKDLADLVARAHAEAKMVLRAALEEGFITQDQFETYKKLDIARELREASRHALSYSEFARTSGIPESYMAGDRETTVPSRKLRLPLSFCKEVVQACETGEVSSSRAAELLMVDEELFRERFATRLKGLMRDEE